MVNDIDYLAIGHVTYDVLPSAARVVGGTVSYAALTAAALQQSVGMLTSAGRDFDFSLFDDNAHVVSHAAPSTTTFRNQYINGYRRQTVYDVAGALTPDLVPESWVRPTIAHVGPVIGECSRDLIDFFAGSAFVGLTPQGWMRSRDDQGQVHAHGWEISREQLAAASAVVFSIDDIRRDWDAAESLAQRTSILVVTMGRDGGRLFIDGRSVPFSAHKVEEIDPTGAGDIFATVFFIGLARGAAPERAAEFAACLASHSVSRVGLRGVPGSEDIAVCAAASQAEGPPR